MIKRHVFVIVILMITLCLTFGAEAMREPGNGSGERPEKIRSDNWLIYWYICGTNLESKDGEATKDIAEMERVKLPPNVKILIQTGTTSKWNHEIVNKNARYLYDSKGLRKISDYTANMYEAETLATFLKYGEKNYKADHRILIFWDHGGVGGVCQDEEDTWNSLSMNDLKSGLEKVYGKSPKEIPFEIIGFDACLMGSYECANNIKGFARYMVASENEENGYGWYYTDWLKELAKNPASNGATLGKKICSGSLKDNINKKASDVGKVTFSVIDMSKFNRLHNAHRNFFLDALNRSATSKGFPRTFNGVVSGNLTSGNLTNEPVESYAKMYVDLKILAEKLQAHMPDTSRELIKAINHAVVGQPSNGDLMRGGGISTYYRYNNENYKLFLDQNCASKEQKEFYNLFTVADTGTSTDEQDNSNAPKGSRSASVKPSLPLEDVAVSVDENKHLVVQLTPEQLELVSSVRCMVIPTGEFENSELGITESKLIILGNDVNFKGNWETGTFRDNFHNVWAALDGHIIFTAVTFSCVEYTIYEVPVKLNGEIRTLEVSYNYKDGKYSILSARKKSVRGIADRNTKYLKAGDEVTPLFFEIVSKKDIDDKPDNIVKEYPEGYLLLKEGTAFTVDENPTIKDKYLGEGEYLYYFEFYGPAETFLGRSQLVTFKVDENNQIVDVTIEN